MRKVFSLLVAVALVFSLTTPALAAAGSITFVDNGTNFQCEVNSDYTSTDLFDNFKDVMPGDHLEETVTIRNGSRKYDYIKVYMRAVPHDEEQNPLTYSESFEAEDGKDQAGVEGLRDETVATMTDFLSQLSMRIYNNGKLIYEASPDEMDGLSQNVYLGTLTRRRSTDLKLELDVPIELGNEYANRVGEVDWVFYVEGHDNPKTGDTNNLTLPLVSMLVSGAALLFILTGKRRKTAK